MLAMGDSALRKEADAMTFVGCDLHTRQQQVAVLDTDTGEVQERRLAHDDQAVEQFYAACLAPSRSASRAPATRSGFTR